MNVCIFTGYLLDKPEMKSSPSGKPVCEVRMNIPRDYKSQDGQRLSDFISIVAWGKTAEILGSCEKGTRVNITTHVRTELYTDKNGIKRESHKYEVDRFEFGERKGVQVPQSGNNNEEVAPAPPTNSSDYIPEAYLQIGEQQETIRGTVVDANAPDFNDYSQNEDLPF